MAPTTVAADPTCEDGSLGGRRYILCTGGTDPAVDPAAEAKAEERLIVAFHGRGSSAEEMRRATELDRVAAAHGLAVVFPEAVDGGWGDDTFATPARPHGDEDVVAVDDLVAALRRDDRIADGPVVVAGFSNGGSMALRYASDRPDQVRGVVSVAGQLPRDPAVRPASRVPLLEVYGTADPIRPEATGIPEPPAREPGGPTPTLSTSDTVAAFVAAAGGEGSVEAVAAVEADPDPLDGTTLRTSRWRDESGDVAVLHLVVGGGHTWPSAVAPFAGGDRFGPTSRDLDTSTEAVTFALAAFASS